MVLGDISAVATLVLLTVEVNMLLSKNQHGFRPKLSTTTALTVLTDKIYNNMDDKRIALLTLCDLSKAFDIVSHNILLEKLLITTVDNFWFDSYLSGRSQSVRVNDTVSTKTDVLYGVPQGSILAPCYSIYMSMTYH